MSARNNSIGTNFHVLYALLQSPLSLKQKLYLTHENFNVILIRFEHQTTNYTFQNIQPFQILPPKMSEQLIWHSFNELDSALNKLEGLSKIRESLYAVLAAVLHLGNVNFVGNHLENAQIDVEDGSHRSLEYAANLLAIDTSILENLLLKKTIKSGNDTTT